MVAGLASSQPESFAPLLALCAARTEDAQSFETGLHVALAENPRNLSALRALTWHHLRNREFGRAAAAAGALREAWPAVGDIRRELIRIALVDPDATALPDLDSAGVELHNAISRQSYALQCALKSGARPNMAARLGLQAECDALAARILRLKDAVDAPLVHRDVLFHGYDTILSAPSVALVGNGPSLKGAGRGAEIDSAGIVIRCNFPRITGHEEDVGSRCDMVFFNETLADKAQALRAAEACYADIPAFGFHPEPGPIFAREAYDRNLGAHGTIIPDLLKLFFRSFCYTRPTTGLMGSLLISVILDSPLKLYGFDFYASPTAHYFASTSPVFLGHEVDYEKWFMSVVLAWLKPGYVSF